MSIGYNLENDIKKVEYDTMNRIINKNIRFKLHCKIRGLRHLNRMFRRVFLH